MLNNIELPKSCMAFKLESGQTLFIHHEDCKRIAMEIITEGLLIDKTIILKEKNTNIERADKLYNVMKSEPDMDKEMKSWYLQQICDLLSSNEVEILNDKNQPVKLEPI